MLICGADHVLVPLNLLLFAVAVAITTATCLADITSWTGFTSAQKTDIYSLYGPYLVLAILMGVDGWSRVTRQIYMGHSTEGGKMKAG